MRAIGTVLFVASVTACSGTATGFNNLSQTVTLRPTDRRIRLDVAPPSLDFITYIEGERIRVSIPSNWRELPGSDAVTFAPEGAYGNAGVKSVFTHGVAMGVARTERHTLQVTTRDFVAAYVLVNAPADSTRRYDNVTLDRRPGLHAVLARESEATGMPEQIEVFTTLLDDATLFYLLAVVPSDAASRYAGTFRRVVASIEFTDCDVARRRRERSEKPRARQTRPSVRKGTPLVPAAGYGGV